MGDQTLLRQWEKRCYKAYCLNEIQDLILESYQDDWPQIIKEHLLRKDPIELGASAIDIYLVAYVTETIWNWKRYFCSVSLKIQTLPQKIIQQMRFGVWGKTMALFGNFKFRWNDSGY